MPKSFISFLGRAAAVVACTFLAGVASAQSMRGAGHVSGHSQACDPSSSRIVSHVNLPRVYYYPGEWHAGAPTQLILDYTDGTAHLQRTAPFAPGTTFINATGRNISRQWFSNGEFGFTNWTVRPRIRVLSRVIMSPPGATIDNADEVFLRLSIRNMLGITGCNATMVATVSGTRSIGGASEPTIPDEAFGSMGLDAGDAFFPD